MAVGVNGAVLSASGATSNGAPPSLTPVLSAAQAMAVVSDDAGAAGPPRRLAGPGGPRRTTRFAGGGVAQLVVFSSRLAWRVDYPAAPAAFYDTIVDATTGAILRRSNLLKSDAPARVWDDYPGGSPTHVVDLEDLGYLGAGATQLENPWLRVFSDEDADDTQEAGEEISLAHMPFDFAPDNSAAGCTAATPCAWNPADPDSWRINRRQVAVQAFYLANRFREYLAAPPIGFDGFDSRHGDAPLNIETDWGAAYSDQPDQFPGAFDNSGMVIGNSVVPWAMELSLFGVDFGDGNHGFRAVDAGDDASIVGHEYTHGFTNQTVVYPDGTAALYSQQAWAIDEASADFFAKSYLVDRGLEPDTDAPGEVDVGDYTDVAPHSIRNEPLDCPVGPSTSVCPAGGYTYADYGNVDSGGPEPHYDGEIWSETMWDLRRALLPGRATRLAAQALAIVAPEPSFLDMRDAILTADAADGYNDAATIWQVFANRGMGCNASTTGGDDVNPHAGFNVPPCSAPAPMPTATPPPPPAVTPQPTVAPTATPVPAPAPPRRPSFRLKRSGRRGVAFTVTCRAACSVTGTLRVSRRVAKRLHLGKRRVIGRRTAKLRAAGHRTYAVRLNRATRRALKRHKVRSFKARLTARAVYPGAAGDSRHRTVRVRR